VGLLEQAWHMVPWQSLQLALPPSPDTHLRHTSREQWTHLKRQGAQPTQVHSGVPQGCRGETLRQAAHCGLLQCAQQVWVMQARQMGLLQPSHARIGLPCLTQVVAEHTGQE
jgi:hypothetical protein